MYLSQITRIKAFFPIAQFVAPHTSGLKSTGHGFFIGVCPFHKSNNPHKKKFWVNTAGGTCGCFLPRCKAYCNQSDDPNSKPFDVVNFHALLKGVSLKEAIADLAKEAGIQ